MRNSGPLKIWLLQCYEVLWIHNIDEYGRHLKELFPISQRNIAKLRSLLTTKHKIMDNLEAIS